MADTVSFEAPEYRADGTVAPARYRFAGSTADGWEIARDGAVALRLGPGYRRLRTSHCGVCATDLARRHLPFPLPQVIGHEVVAVDDDGRAVVVEINASHVARGVAGCATCAAGLPTHCPERLTLASIACPAASDPGCSPPPARCTRCRRGSTRAPRPSSSPSRRPSTRSAS